MAEKNYQIPKEKFAFVHDGERISDKKFEDKPIGYFRDAWIRFRKSKASVVAAIIIIAIVLYSFLAPLLITSHDALVSVYLVVAVIYILINYALNRLSDRFARGNRLSNVQRQGETA